LACQNPDEGLTFVVRSLDGAFIGSSSYLQRRRGQPASGDRRHLVCAFSRRSGVNSETEAADARVTPSTVELCGSRNSAHTSSTPPAGRQSNALAPSATACCAARGTCRRIAPRHRGVLDPRHRMACGAQQPAVPLGPQTAKPPRLRPDRDFPRRRSPRSFARLTSTFCDETEWHPRRTTCWAGVRPVCTARA